MIAACFDQTRLWPDTHARGRRLAAQRTDLGGGDPGWIAWSLREADEKQIVAGHLEDGLQNPDKFSAENLARITRIFEQLADRKPAAYDKYKSRGHFFAMFEHRDIQNGPLLRLFANREFGKHPDCIDVIVMSREGRAGVIVILRGVGGLENVLAEIEKQQRLRLYVVGHVSRFKGMREKIPGLEKYIDKD